MLQQDEELRIAISNAEQIGDLEEAARLEYYELNNLQKRRQEIESTIASVQEAGNALLREQVEAEDIADAALFLSSERASFITGSVFRVDGGQTTGMF